MADVFWLVSIPNGDQFSGSDFDTDELTLVEFRDSWSAAKRRFAELHAEGCEVDLFDMDGELLRSQESELSRGRMSAPRVAGFYAWNEVTGHSRVELPPAVGWRGTVGRYNEQRTGCPGENGDPSRAA